jgi:hypothetical protein
MFDDERAPVTGLAASHHRSPRADEKVSERRGRSDDGRVVTFTNQIHAQIGHIHIGPTLVCRDLRTDR